MCTFFKSLLLLFQLTFYRMSLRVNKQANEVLAKSLQTSCEFEKNCSSLNPWLPILGLFKCLLVCSDAFIRHVISIKGMKFWLTIFLAPHLFQFELGISFVHRPLMRKSLLMNSMQNERFFFFPLHNVCFEVRQSKKVIDLTQVHNFFKVLPISLNFN